MRIAFFGGSFDPPHLGHLRIAQAAAERLHLDRILLAPVALQPLKRELKAPPPASYADRVTMLRLFIADQAQAPAAKFELAISELDAPRPDAQPNYTYETLLALRAQLTSEDRLFVLLGADSFLSVRRWYRAADLLPLAEWIVAARPGFDLSQLEQALPSSVRLDGPVVEGSGYLTQQVESLAGHTALYLLPDLHEEVSATAIRSALAANAGSSQSAHPARTSPLTPPVLSPSVASYIRAHSLYR